MKEPHVPPPIPATRSWRGLLLGPVSRETWRSYSFAAVSLVVSTAFFTIVVVSVTVSAALGILIIGLPLLAASLVMTGAFSRIEQARIYATLNVTIGEPTYCRADPSATLARRIRVIITDRRRWSEVLYFVAALGLMLLAMIALAATSAGLALIAYPLYRHVGDLDLPLVAVLGVVVGGIILIFAGPVLAQWATRKQANLASSLLGPDTERSAQQEASDRIDRLTETRLGVVDAADSERRRIERDLHDGAQQRLVALGLELGMAKRTATDPQTAAVIDHAHAEVKETLAELRDLVRGIHPAILTDRGFDAALSALAARCPIAVTVDVQQAGRLDTMPDPVKTAGYFVAAEALTNVAKHSHATGAHVRAEPLDEPVPALRLTVMDDGVGGAQVASGGGLAGLRGRVEALDGELRLDSSRGNGTHLVATIPMGGPR